MKNIAYTLILGCAFAGTAHLSAQDDPPANQPDLVVASKGKEPVGNDIYGRPVGQTIRNRTVGARPVRYTIGVQNDGTEADRIQVRGSRSDRKFRVGYRIGDRNATAAVARGVRLPLEAGEANRIHAIVKATRLTKGKNARKALRYSAVSSGDRTKRDSAASLVYKKKKSGGRSDRS